MKLLERNEIIIDEVEVASIEDKIRETRLTGLLILAVEILMYLCGGVRELTFLNVRGVGERPKKR